MKKYLKHCVRSINDDILISSSHNFLPNLTHKLPLLSEYKNVLQFTQISHLCLYLATARPFLILLPHMFQTWVSGPASLNYGKLNKIKHCKTLTLISPYTISDSPELFSYHNLTYKCFKLVINNANRKTPELM